MIDLRSDTVTRPTAGMMEAMMAAKVGDDVFGDDPTVNALQNRVAQLFGKEAALFFPSGTMANQAAIQCHVSPGDEVICDQYAHVYKYEGGGIAANSGASVRLIHGERGIFSGNDVRQSLNADDPHFPISKLVCVENTMNRGGGACWSKAQIEDVCQTSRELGLGVHLDGARLWNAMVATGMKADYFGSQFDSISICFSKGLGCPVGSILVGDTAFIKKAHRIRKRLGGGMRQIGILAAACNYALDQHVDRLATDHKHAKEIESILNACGWVENILAVETNILMFDAGHAEQAKTILLQLKEKGIYASHTGEGWIRFTFHLDISEAVVQELAHALKTLG